MTGGDYYEYTAGQFAVQVHQHMSGEVYENERVAGDDAAFRFETTTMILRGAMIRVSANDVVMGDSSNQRYPKASGGSVSVGDVDLSKLYFKNAVPGSNTQINIIGVVE